MIQLAIREYHVASDGMTYRAGETVFDFKNQKARIAYQAQMDWASQGHEWGYVPVDDLKRICSMPGDGFGNLHTGPRNKDANKEKAHD